MVNTTSKKVLIIDDDVSLCRALKDKLNREGFSTLIAKNGEEGLAVALQEHPDIILLNIVMPVMDGMTMLKKLRETDEWGKQIPVILLTNLAADDSIMAGVTRDEPTYYLVKSDWKIEDVVTKVKETLGI